MAFLVPVGLTLAKVGAEIGINYSLDAAMNDGKVRWDDPLGVLSVYELLTGTDTSNIWNDLGSFFSDPKRHIEYAFSPRQNRQQFVPLKKSLMPAQIKEPRAKSYYQMTASEKAKYDAINSKQNAVLQQRADNSYKLVDVLATGDRGYTKATAPTTPLKQATTKRSLVNEALAPVYQNTDLIHSQQMAYNNSMEAQKAAELANTRDLAEVQTTYYTALQSQSSQTTAAARRLLGSVQQTPKAPVAAPVPPTRLLPPVLDMYGKKVGGRKRK
jgi:hypothetical protein